MTSTKATTPNAAAARWPELAPLNGPELPDFPAYALPKILRDWTEATAQATQTPLDLPGLLALAVYSACIARHLSISPQPGWTEPVNLFVAVLQEPASRKSAVFSDATRPLRELEAAMIESARPAMARDGSERRQLQRRQERLERLAADKGDAGAAAEAAELAERLAEWPEPVLPRLIADDVTAERLAMMLAEQGGRIASLSPEGGPFDLMAGRYSKNLAADFTVYLMGHAGDDLRIDRVTRPAVHVQRPAVTAAYAIQPQVISGVACNPAFRGRGLLARFLYAAPASRIGRREISPDPVPEEVSAAYMDAVMNLAQNPPQGTITLQGEPARLFHDWQGEIEGMLGDGGDMEAIRDWGGKLAGATARLIAVLHCAQHSEPLRRGVDMTTVQTAIEIGRYLIPHAEAVLTIMAAGERQSDDDAQYILRWMKRHRQREFTKRDVHQHGKRRFPRADDIEPALRELARRGYIRPKPQDGGSRGRQPSPAYEVNPALFENSSGGISGNSGSAFQELKNVNRERIAL